MSDHVSRNRRAFPDAHHRLVLSIVLAVGAFLVLQNQVGRFSQLLAAWDVFVMVDLVLAWWVILRSEPADVRETIGLQDSSRTAIFVLVLASACAALVSVAFVLGPSRGTGGSGLGLHIVLSVVAIVGSWLVVHTLFALRYAHLYFTKAEKAGNQSYRGGLEFPGTLKPDYLDFVYFSYVIGMTSQVSDVQISARPLRRLALLHSIVSFFFNVVILGLTVSAMAGLL